MDNNRFKHEYLPAVQELTEIQTEDLRFMVNQRMSHFERLRELPNMPTLDYFEMGEVINDHKVNAMKHYLERTHRKYVLALCKAKVEEFEDLIKAYRG